MASSNPRKSQENNRLAFTESQSTRFSLKQHDISQANGTTPSLETSSLLEFQLTVDKLNQRHLELKQARHESNLKRKGLEDRKERNSQTLVELQMQLEHESGQHEELTKCRETLQQRMHYVMGIGESFRHHQDNINESFSELTKGKGLLEQMSSEASETFRLIDLKNREVLPHQFLKIRSLLNELEEEKHQSKKLEEELNHTSLSYKRHDDSMSSLKTKCDHLDVTLKEKGSELISLKENSRDQAEAERNKLELLDKEIQALDAHVTEAKAKYENLNLEHETLQKEKECCLSHVDVSQKEVDCVTKSISATEAEKHSLEQQKQEINVNLCEREMALMSSVDNLRKLQMQHDEMHLQLTSLQQESLQHAEKKLQKISELNEQFAVLKSTNSTQLNELGQALQLAASDTDETAQMIQSTKDGILTAKSELQTARNLVCELESTHSQLNNLLTDQNSEMQNLVSEIERLQKSVTDERKRVSDLDKLHLIEQESIGQEERTLHSKLEAAEEKVSNTRQSVLDFKDRLASLHQKLEDMSKESLKKQESTNYQFSSKKADLEEEIKQLTDLKNKISAENEGVSSNLSKDLNHRMSLLDVQAKKIKGALEVRAALHKEVSVSKQTLMDQSQDISTAEESEVSMNQTLKNLQEDAFEVEKQLFELNAHYLEQSATSKAKSEKISSLKKSMDNFEISKNEALFKNSADMKSLLSEIVESKETCESLLSQTSQLNSEVDGLKKNYALANQELETIQKSILIFNTKTQTVLATRNQKQGVLEKLRGDLEKCQRRAQRASLELQSFKEEHQSFIQQIHDAKARKRARLAGALVSEEQKMMASASQTTTPQTTTPQASTPQVEDQKNTPRSILKSTKTSTPQSAKKSVSFMIE